MKKVLISEKEYRILKEMGEQGKVTQEEFDKTFLVLLKECPVVVFLDKHGNRSELPTNRIELTNSRDEVFFDIQFNDENKHFFMDDSNVVSVFEKKYSLSIEEIQLLMQHQMKILFGLNDITPQI